MYYKVNQKFLTNRSISFLTKAFIDSCNCAQEPKDELIEYILKKYKIDQQTGTNTVYFCKCEFCRKSYILQTGIKNIEPKYCTYCYRYSPVIALHSSIKKSEALIRLAAKMNTKKEKHDKSVLLEQALVCFATGIEIMLRECYSLIFDLKHVVFGESIRESVYKETKNSFTNIGSACKLYRNVSNINVKTELGDHFSKINRLFSCRHIIVHNNGLKDEEYISQIGERDSELGLPLKLSVKELRSYIPIIKHLSMIIDKQLSETIIIHCEKECEIINSFKI